MVIADYFVNENFGDNMITLTPNKIKKRFKPLFTQKSLIEKIQTISWNVCPYLTQASFRINTIDKMAPWRISLILSRELLETGS